jgi:hypothetical protein
MKTIGNALHLAVVSAAVAGVGYLLLNSRIMVGPVILGLGALPLGSLVLTRRRITRALPDIIFGSIDTGLLAIPTLFGGFYFGVAGAVTGAVVGDALTDSVAGFFEGSIAVWMRERGIEESREPITTGLGKMAGCLVGSGLVLTVFLAFGVTPDFG